MQWNSPPNWPAPPPGWTPPPGWQPDPAWGPAPAGWQFYSPSGSDHVGQSRPWAARHKLLTAILAVVGLLAVASALGGGSEEAENLATESSSSPAASPVLPAAESPPVTKKAAPPKPAAPASAKPTPAALPPPPPAPAAPEYAGALEDDKVAVKPGAPVELSGWTTTATALKVGDDTLGDTLCTTVKLVNRDKEAQDYIGSSWKLQGPSGNIEDITLFGSDDLLDLSGGLAPGGSVVGDVCFDTKAVPGQYVLSWQPDIFSSTARGIWLNKL